MTNATISLTPKQTNDLLMHLNHLILHYGDKAVRKNASIHVKRMNLVKAQEVQNLWREVFNARQVAGITFEEK